MSSLIRFFVEISHALSDHSVVVEDDGRVAYAYLLKKGRIVADVWLYNRGVNPDKIERDKANMPFQNPTGFANPVGVDPIKLPEEIQCEWDYLDDLQEVKLFIRGELFARLRPGAKPGWSKLALRDGPLARVLE